MNESNIGGVGSIDDLLIDDISVHDIYVLLIDHDRILTNVIMVPSEARCLYFFIHGRQEKIPGIYI